ncbi:hypothetical protein R3P38DRAFT_303535 [Favolaschia claudopus]|uniref:C2H2-type domain-containing protein n=1 Tax=Favolaschia claudopus TaxID=2862362 RepID=A0AAW0CPI7_9AGAR
MSFALPIEALCEMQLSFRVSLEDGTFSFDMVPLNLPGSSSHIPYSQQGMQVHFHPVVDRSGVTLTLFASTTPSHVDPSRSHSPSRENPPPLASMPASPHDFHFSPVPEYIPPGASLPLGPVLNVERQSEGSGAFLNMLEFGYNPHTVLPFGSSRHYHGGMGAEDPFTGSSQSSSTDTDDCSTPSTSSPSLPGFSPASVSRDYKPKLPCPKPGCMRRFSSNYTLSKHLVSHEPKPQKSFPCTMGCALHFSRKHDRLRHEVTQHGRLCEWECRTCLGFFSSEATLKKHKCKSTPGGSRWNKDRR